MSISLTNNLSLLPFESIKNLQFQKCKHTTILYVCTFGNDNHAKIAEFKNVNPTKISSFKNENPTKISTFKNDNPTKI